MSDTGAHGLPQMMPAPEVQRHTYTLTELEADTHAVIDRIRHDGPALITRHGRFVAMISPISDQEVMAKMFEDESSAEVLGIEDEDDRL